MVWSGYTFERLKTITSHQSHVKGITFDPANKYFATASDDRSVHVFRFTPPGPNSTAHDQATNFVREKEIREPFVGSPITTYFRRCSWSPDGAHIGCANAVNGPVSSVAIVDRGNWGGDIALIGHELPVEVCAFCPRLWSPTPIDQTQAGNGQLASLVTVIACAGQDKSISIWITSNSKPIIIAQDLAIKSLSDLAWSPDGSRLFATSLDGSIIALVFRDRELGYSASMEANEMALAKFGGGRKAAGLLEGPLNLILEEKSKEGEIRGVEGRMGALMGDGVPASQVDETSKTLRSEPVANGTKSQLVNAQVNGESAQAQITSREDVASKAAQDIRAERLKSRVTYTKDGRKRVAPLLVSSSNVGESALPRTQLRVSNATGQGPAIDAPQTVLDLSKPFDGLPRGGLAAVLLGNRRKLASIEGDEEGIAEKRVANASRDGAVPILGNTTDGLTLAQPTTNATSQVSIPEFLRPAVVNPSLSVSSVRLAVPKLRATITRSLDPSASTDNNNSKQDNKDPNLFLEAKNPTGPSPTGRFEDREPARLVVSRKGLPVFIEFLPKSVLLVAGGLQFWAAACEDGSLYAWSPAGRRLISALVLESQPVILEARNSWLLCITAAGLAYVWNIADLSSPHPPVSVAPILDIATHSLSSHTTKAPAITSAHLNSEGRIVITLTNGDGYTYSPTLFAWQRLSEVWWAVSSQYWNKGDSSVGNLKSSKDDKAVDNTSEGIISFLERHTATESQLRGRAYVTSRLVKALLPREGYETFESSVSIAHLENRLAAAMTLGAKADFQSNLLMYAKRLGVEGLKIKTEELLRGLMSPGDDDDYGDEDGEEEEGRGGGKTNGTVDHKLTKADDRTWSASKDTICGWDRKELLRAVVIILGTYLTFQSVGHCMGIYS